MIFILIMKSKEKSPNVKKYHIYSDILAKNTVFAN